MSSSSPVLITGAGGVVGAALSALPGALGLDRRALDITDVEAVEAALDEHRPAAVINAAAQAGVDAAERDPTAAFAVNAAAVDALAQRCARRGLRLVHLSTDYVLDAPGMRVLTPALPPRPRSAYARSKLTGERAALARGAVVVRLQWVWSPGRRGFFNLALRRLAAGQPLSLVVDQVGRPTPAPLLAPALLRCARGGPAGLYHLACGGETNAWGWIRAGAEAAGLPFSATPVTRAELGGAWRPARSCLGGARFHLAWGCRLPPWRDALEAVMMNAPDHWSP